ncbi:MAG: hypothetical protein ACRECH_10420 [Nitrososphaerales archaeon]
MKVFFAKGSNALYTELVVSSTRGSWTKKYEKCIVDTGAWNTGIPLSDISPPELKGKFNLKTNPPYPHRTQGIGNYDEFVSMFEANLLVGEEDHYPLAIIAGFSMKWPVVGREILSLYKWEIDWQSKSVVATKNKEEERGESNSSSASH